LTYAADRTLNRDMSSRCVDREAHGARARGWLQAVVFDLDGVLIDSEPLMRFAFAESYRSVIGDGSPPIELYLEHMGESFPRIMDRLGLPHSLWTPYRDICRAHIGLIRMYPESRRILAFCRSMGLQLAILTGKDQVRTQEILRHFNLEQFFSVVAASDQLTHTKPHPEGILFTLDRLDCEPHNAVMIGDAVNDILCAHSAGVLSIAVTWGTKPERLSLCSPDWLVHDFEGLRRLLEQLMELPPR
jgi:3-amino-5-hydroxybenzoic acid synthesis related protein